MGRDQLSRDLLEFPRDVMKKYVKCVGCGLCAGSVGEGEERGFVGRLVLPQKFSPRALRAPT